MADINLHKPLLQCHHHGVALQLDTHINQYYMHLPPFVHDSTSLHPLLHYNIFMQTYVSHVSYKTVEVYLSGTCLRHNEYGLPDPTNDDLLQLVVYFIAKLGSSTLIKKNTGSMSSYMVSITYIKLKEIRHYRNIMYVLLISYVAGKQLITPMKAQPRVALPLLLIDLQEKTILLQLIFYTKFCVCYQYINSGSGLLFKMCGHCCKISSYV